MIDCLAQCRVRCVALSAAYSGAGGRANVGSGAMACPLAPDSFAESARARADLTTQIWMPRGSHRLGGHAERQRGMGDSLL